MSRNPFWLTDDQWKPVVERLLAVAFIRNDWLASTLMELAAQFGAVVGLVAEHVF